MFKGVIKAATFADGLFEQRQSDTGLAGRRVTAIRYFITIKPARLQEQIIDLIR